MIDSCIKQVIILHRQPHVGTAWPQNFLLDVDDALRSESVHMPVSRATKLTLGCKPSDAHILVRLHESTWGRPWTLRKRADFSVATQLQRETALILWHEWTVWLIV